MKPSEISQIMHVGANHATPNKTKTPIHFTQSFSCSKDNPQGNKLHMGYGSSFRSSI